MKILNNINTMEEEFVKVDAVTEKGRCDECLEMRARLIMLGNKHNISYGVFCQGCLVKALRALDGS